MTQELDLSTLAKRLAKVPLTWEAWEKELRATPGVTEVGIAAVKKFFDSLKLKG